MCELVQILGHFDLQQQHMQHIFKSKGLECDLWFQEFHGEKTLVNRDDFREKKSETQFWRGVIFGLLAVIGRKSAGISAHGPKESLGIAQFHQASRYLHNGREIGQRNVGCLWQGMMFCRCIWCCSQVEMLQFMDVILPSYKGNIISQNIRMSLTNHYNGMSQGFWSMLTFF